MIFMNLSNVIILTHVVWGISNISVVNLGIYLKEFENEDIIDVEKGDEDISNGSDED